MDIRNENGVIFIFSYVAVMTRNTVSIRIKSTPHPVQVIRVSP